MRIDDTVALITGGASGLGRELSLGFARAGADVLVVDIDEEAGEQVAALVRDEGRSAWFEPVDVRQDGQVQALVRRAETLGGPHILVNNAGGWGNGAQQFPLSPVSEWTAVLDLNLRAPMLLTQLCLAPMRRAGGGVVVNIASSGGVGYAAYASPEYAAAKAGLIRLTACLSALPDHGVRAACVVPDWIGLDRAHDQLSAMSEELRSAAPRLIPPQDVVDAVLDLVRDDTKSGSVVELWGGEPPLLMQATQRGSSGVAGPGSWLQAVTDVATS
jgi:NAD(P)-dependent dehydrogenase (short-subunit alcohol dehydrogenase family)